MLSLTEWPLCKGKTTAPESHKSHFASQALCMSGQHLPLRDIRVSTATVLTVPSTETQVPRGHRLSCVSLHPSPICPPSWRPVTADCAWPSPSRQAVWCTWSRKGRLENTGKFLAHLTAMKSRRADVSWMPSRLQGDAGNSGSLLVTSIFSSAGEGGGFDLSACSAEAGCGQPRPLPSTYRPQAPA